MPLSKLLAQKCFIGGKAVSVIPFWCPLVNLGCPRESWPRTRLLLRRSKGWILRLDMSLGQVEVVTLCTHSCSWRCGVRK